MSLPLFFLVVALVLFALAALKVGGRVDLGWAGLFCLTLSVMLGRGLFG